ncbi:hypothetical protein IJ096_01025 [Candidatus Saccharibacteria bacterium]|nr:hypothetical protein [Candidatus Saccharibacteria bacterium]
MHEINLVPDIKLRMIKILKLRNLVFFICIIVVAVSVGAAIITGTVAGAQRVAMEAKNGRIEAMSKKLSDYGNLGEFLTIQDQLGNISTIDSNRKILSRVFGLLNAIVPKSGDKVEISDLNVNLEEMSLSMEAQADAGKEPDIDYRVLEAFKKGVSLSKFDYGRYVDEGGAEIPTNCIIEAKSDGSLYQKDGAFYAYWKKNKKGCHPSVEADAETDEEDEEDEEDGNNTTNTNNTNADNTNNTNESVEADQDMLVKIWRTPRFEEWLKLDSDDNSNNSDDKNNTNNSDSNTSGNTETSTSSHNEDGEKMFDDNEKYDASMSLSGTIEGVPHFESQCIKYEGTEGANKKIKWESSNECMLTDEGLNVQDSSNGKDSDDKLVLRFTASMVVNEDIFKFTNKHVMVIGPEAQDVTDSYQQLQGIFAEKASDCKEGDTECSSNTKNSGGNS